MLKARQTAAGPKARRCRQEARELLKRGIGLMWGKLPEDWYDTPLSAERWRQHRKNVEIAAEYVELLEQLDGEMLEAGDPAAAPPARSAEGASSSAGAGSQPK